MISREHPLPLTRQCRHIQPLPVRHLLHPCAGKRQGQGTHASHRRDSSGSIPTSGSRGIRNELWNKGHKVGRSHVRTLMRKMGIEAIYQKPRLSKPHPGHTIYPYLLRGLDITEANTVWCSDITYIPMAKGFCYLVAIMDWASRKVLSWRLSNTLDTSFCIDALEEALSLYGTPHIFNTDQGSQFTSDEFTDILKNHDIRISMDGQGPLDGQRLHREALEEREI